jgi:murein DD-endopeptidase MepM/ murein hydrolase activator NlpD
LANCGWTRLAYLLFALSILITLAQVENPSAPRSLAAKQVLREPAQTAALTSDEQDHPNGVTAGSPASVVTGSGPPVFYRPASANPTPDPVCAGLGTVPSTHRIAFPLPRKYLDSYENTWGATRPQGGHEGTDFMIPTGTAEYAVTDGTIVAVAGANENGWNTLGGYTVMLEAAYSVGPIKKGDLFYYAHLNRRSVRAIGTRVSAGQTVGYVGDMGRGPEVTRGLVPPHLHLGWYAVSGAGSTITSAAMNPYPLLEWIKANGGAISGGSNAHYCETSRIGGPVPSTGRDRWPAPPSPGVSPDLAPASENHESQIHPAPKAVPTDQEQPAPNEGSAEAPGKAAPQPATGTPTPSTGDTPSSRSPNPPAPSVGPPSGEEEASEQGTTEMEGE